MGLHLYYLYVASCVSLIFFCGSSESKLSCFIFVPAAMNCCFFGIEGTMGFGNILVWEIWVKAVWAWVPLADSGSVGSLGTK